jgi:hypothetical protein
MVRKGKHIVAYQLILKTEWNDGHKEDVDLIDKYNLDTADIEFFIEEEEEEENNRFWIIVDENNKKDK